jgi:hypothetical protein
LFFWWLVWWLRKSAIFFIVWGLCLVIWVIPGGLTCLDSHHLVLSRTFKSKSSLSCQSDRSRPSIVVVVVYLSVGVYLSIVSLGLRSFNLQDKCRKKVFWICWTEHSVGRSLQLWRNSFVTL